MPWCYTLGMNHVLHIAIPEEVYAALERTAKTTQQTAMRPEKSLLFRSDCRGEMVWTQFLEFGKLCACRPQLRSTPNNPLPSHATAIA